MAGQIFERIEKKYLLDEYQYTELQKVLKGKFQIDNYGKTTINNIYYASAAWSATTLTIPSPRSSPPSRPIIPFPTRR